MGRILPPHVPPGQSQAAIRQADCDRRIAYDIAGCSSPSPTIRSMSFDRSLRAQRAVRRLRERHRARPAWRRRWCAADGAVRYGAAATRAFRRARIAITPSVTRVKGTTNHSITRT
jgi:hypothetical protein